MTPAAMEARTEVPVVAQAAEGGVMSTSPAALILGPVPCIACKQPVAWWRIGGLLRLMNARGRRTAHRCVLEAAA